MRDRFAAFIVGEGNWLPLAMGLAFIAAGRRYFSASTTTETRRLWILAAMNLFTGVMLLVMGVGHLLAVTTKLLHGTLRGTPVLFYAIGIAIVIPAALIIRHTSSILASDTTRTTVKLNAWMAVTLGVLGLVNLPLAVPALCNIGYALHKPRWAGWAILGVFLVATVGLFAGGLIFMASGQTFEEFSARP